MAQELGVQELFQQLQTLIYGVWRKRWYMISSAWLVCIMVWGVIATMPYKYEASAQIFVDTETILPSIARNLGVNLNVQRQVEVVRNTLITRPNLERIIRRTDYLEGLANTETETNQVVNYLQRRIRINPEQQGLFRITFEIDDARLTDRERAEVAKDVVQSLLNLFLEAKQGSEGTEAGRNFLQQQIEEYKRRLESAEAARARFRQENLDFLGGQGGFLGKLESARAELVSTRNRIEELDVTVTELKEQLANTPPTIRSPVSAGGGGRRSRDPLEERIEEQQRTLDQLKANGLKDRHPDVVNVTSLIERLQGELAIKQEQVRADLAEAQAQGATSIDATEQPNRLFEQLTLQMIEARTALKRLQQREVQQVAALDDLEEKAKRVPEVEAEEQRLTRDYNSIRQQYRELVEESQDVELQTQISSQDAVALRIVEDPVTPQQPSGPPRILYLTFTLVGGLVVGFMIALMVSQIRPEIITVNQLRAHFDLPVVGSVTRVLTEDESRQQSKELIAFLSVGMLLFVFYLMFVMVDFFGLLTFG